VIRSTTVTYTAVDCQGFAGGFTLGVVQAGFQLVGKREKKGGFGARNCEVNRHLLGDGWQTEAIDPSEWSVPVGGASLVFGNPPCSGFSVLSAMKFRGTDSKINQCMWDFVEYAARVRPEVAIFESVQLAFTQGRSLMRDLRQRLEDLTGERYALYHVLHNALSVGGPAMRKRYFWVASRVPFGVQVPQLDRIPLLQDVIGDLQTLDQRWDSQRYRFNTTWYTKRRFRDRHVDGSDWVDGHISLDNLGIRRALELYDTVGWNPSEHLQQVTQRYFDIHGDVPPRMKHMADKLKNRDFFQGFQTQIMWHPEHHARVVTGNALIHIIHWAERRTFTHREAARILGFPDSWLIEPLRGTPELFMTWGKGITVDCGRWIAEWTRRSLDGRPGALTGEEIGVDERLINVTNTWKMSCDTVKRVANVRWKENIMTEVATDEAATAEQIDDGRRGRPRPSETIDRDQKVFDVLATSGLTRETISTTLGLESNLVYLSLWRLKRDGRVERVRHDGANVWQRIAGAV
jgi:site-specific DNA-cytosine methylase